MLIYAWWDHHDWGSRNAVSWRGPRLILWWRYLDYLITRVRGLRIEFPLPTSLVIKLVTSIKIRWVHHLLTCLHVRGVSWVPTIYVGGLGPNTQSPTLLVLWLHIMTGSNATAKMAYHVTNMVSVEGGRFALRDVVVVDWWWIEAQKFQLVMKVSFIEH